MGRGFAGIAVNLNPSLSPAFQILAVWLQELDLGPTAGFYRGGVNKSPKMVLPKQHFMQVMPSWVQGGVISVKWGPEEQVGHLGSDPIELGFELGINIVAVLNGLDKPVESREAGPEELVNLKTNRVHWCAGWGLFLGGGAATLFGESADR